MQVHLVQIIRINVIGYHGNGMMLAVFVFSFAKLMEQSQS
jgi:hypothetical protein